MDGNDAGCAVLTRVYHILSDGAICGDPRSADPAEGPKTGDPQQSGRHLIVARRLAGRRWRLCRHASPAPPVHGGADWAAQSAFPTVVTRLLDAAHHTGDLRDAVVLEILAFS